MFRTMERYEEAGLGLPYAVVLLDSAEEEIDDVTGQVVGISVPDLEQLVAAVAIVRALHPMQLSGQEVRFIRRALGMTATAFAEELSVDKATYSRWENGKQQVGEWADKQVRLIAIIKLGKQVPCLSRDTTEVVGMHIRKTDAKAKPEIEMRRVQTADPAGCDGEAEAWDSVPLAHAA